MNNLSPSLFRRYSEYDLEGSKILVRIDINLPVGRDGRVESFYKIRKHFKTLETLKDSALVLISHQGRVGDDNFITMEQHGEWLYNALGERFKYVMDIIGESAIKAIKDVEPGEIVLLDNVRLLSEETLKAPPEKLKDTIFVRRLSPYFDYYINDAFGAIHRSHTSLVGFPLVLKSMIGPLMEEELEMLNRLVYSRGKSAFILGGSKLETKIKVMENILEFNPESTFLLGGMVATAMHAIYGSIPKREVKNILSSIDPNLVEICRNILEKYGDRIYLPIDYRYVDDGKVVEKRIEEYRMGDAIEDIGSGTVDKYLNILKEFDRVIINGPMGIIENSLTRWGTEEILKGVARLNIFKMIGGGHMVLSLERLGLIDRYDYVSTGGGSMLTLLSGDLPLPLRLLMK